MRKLVLWAARSSGWAWERSENSYCRKCGKFWNRKQCQVKMEVVICSKKIHHSCSFAPLPHGRKRLRQQSDNKKLAVEDVESVPDTTAAKRKLLKSAHFET